MVTLFGLQGTDQDFGARQRGPELVTQNDGLFDAAWSLLLNGIKKQKEPARPVALGGFPGLVDLGGVTLSA